MNQHSNDKNNIKTENYISTPNESTDAPVHTIKDAMDKLPTQEPRQKHVPFWSENPNILLHQKFIFEFFPVEGMNYNQKLVLLEKMMTIFY